MQTLAQSVRNKFTEMFNGTAAKITVTTDAWKGTDGCSYICLTAHFIDQGWNLQSFCAGVMACGADGHPADVYATTLVELLQ
jgi:hypothetical protein